MNFKKFLIFLCLIMVMFTVASVSASDVNETVITSNDVQDDEIAVSNEEDVMTATTQTMTDLKKHNRQ